MFVLYSPWRACNYVTIVAGLFGTDWSSGRVSATCRPLPVHHRSLGAYPSGTRHTSLLDKIKNVLKKKIKKNKKKNKNKYHIISIKRITHSISTGWVSKVLLLFVTVSMYLLSAWYPFNNSHEHIFNNFHERNIRLFSF